MECKEALSLIDMYNEDKLRGTQKEQFLLHVKNCSSCYEELDIKFIVTRGLKGLDSKEPTDFNFSGMLHSKIEKEMGHIKRHHSVLQTVLLFILIVLTALMVILL
jgi:hypothetical protein